MKIHIFGASGSGVTTLGKQLAEKLTIPYFDADDYFWEKSEPPFTVRRNPEERNALLKNGLKSSGLWILGGSIISWGDPFFSTVDLAVFLWIPPEVRIERLKKRELERYGNIIYDDPDRNKLFTDFIDWASGYDKNMTRGRTLAAHEDWMKKLLCPVLEIRENIPTEKRMELILNKLKTLYPLK